MKKRVSFREPLHTASDEGIKGESKEHLSSQVSQLRKVMDRIYRITISDAATFDINQESDPVIIKHREGDLKVRVLQRNATFKVQVDDVKDGHKPLSFEFFGELSHLCPSSH